jgi:hypothetical protein
MESLPRSSTSRIYGSGSTSRIYGSGSSSSLLGTTMTPLRRQQQQHKRCTSSSQMIANLLKEDCTLSAPMPVAPHCYPTEDKLSLQLDHDRFRRRRVSGCGRKQVTFDANLCVVHEYIDPCACFDDLYYTPQERLEMQMEYRSLVKSFARTHRQRCAQFDRLFERDEALVAMTTSDPNDKTNQLLQELSMVRGLESTFSKAMHRHRKSAIQSVLNLQESMQQHQRRRPLTAVPPPPRLATGSNANLIALGLRACSVHASQKSRILAQCLAALDAVAAAAATATALNDGDDGEDTHSNYTH